MKRFPPVLVLALLAITGLSAAPMSAWATDTAPTGLTSDLLYRILLGEIATQRGNRSFAVTQYLEAARISADARLAELATRAALASKDYGAARQAVERWLELTPDALAPHLLGAHVAGRLGLQDQARRHLHDAVALAEPEGRDGFLQIAALATKIEPTAQRLDLMRRLVAEAPETAEAYYALAAVAADSAHYDEAIEAARQALELAPDWDQPRIILVRVLIAQGKRKQARQILEGLVDTTPQGHVLRMLYAQLLVEDRELSSARNVFERMLSETPKEPDVLFAIAILSLQLDDPEAARDYFERLYATGERSNDAALYLGQIEEAAANLDKALDWYQKVEGEGAADAQVRAASVLASRGEIAQARELLARLRASSPELSATLFLIEGEMLREHDQPDEALTVFDQALAEHPDHEDLLYARALHAVSLGQIDVLERDLRRILAANPDHADALNALGYTLADQTDRHEEALELIGKALTLKPEEPAILDSMGWVLFKMGRHAEALGYLRQAYERMPDGEIGAHLGEVLWISGQRQAAWRVWDEALAANPDHAYLKQVIERYRYSRPDTSR